ncbi:hypothetical protein HN51_071456, partial [Arachis hypogaea]
HDLNWCDLRGTNEKQAEKMSYMKDQPRSSVKHQKSESNSTYNTGESNPGNNLWTDGLICAFEFVQGRKKPIKHKSPLKISDKLNLDVYQCKRPDKDNLSHHSSVNSLRDSSLGASDDDKESQFSSMNWVAGLLVARFQWWQTLALVEP